ncbi:MAG: DUF2811 domain-containing protein [Cyanobacteria bacterium P01_F01_bin.56]
MSTTTTTRPVSLLIEVPEPLHEALQDYLDAHPDWDQDRVFAAALSLFLMQNGSQSRGVRSIYVDTLFDFAV